MSTKLRKIEPRNASDRLNTPTDLSDDAIKEISAALNGLLADTFALYVKTKNFPLAYQRPTFPRLPSASGRAGRTDRGQHRHPGRAGSQDRRNDDPLDRPHRQASARQGQRRRVRPARRHARGADGRQQGPHREHAQGARDRRRARGRRHREPARSTSSTRPRSGPGSCSRPAAARIAPARSRDRQPEHARLYSAILYLGKPEEALGIAIAAEGGTDVASRIAAGRGGGLAGRTGPAGAQALDYAVFKASVEPIFITKRAGYTRCVVCHAGANNAFRLERLPGASGSSPRSSRARISRRCPVWWCRVSRMTAICLIYPLVPRKAARPTIRAAGNGRPRTIRTGRRSRAGSAGRNRRGRVTLKSRKK